MFLVSKAHNALMYSMISAPFLCPYLQFDAFYDFRRSNFKSNVFSSQAFDEYFHGGMRDAIRS
jgi:hypothetical protein